MNRFIDLKIVSQKYWVVDTLREAPIRLAYLKPSERMSYVSHIHHELISMVDERPYRVFNPSALSISELSVILLLQVYTPSIDDGTWKFYACKNGTLFGDVLSPKLIIEAYNQELRERNDSA